MGHIRIQSNYKLYPRKRIFCLALSTFLTFVSLISTKGVRAQILSDSSVQVVGYWGKMEKQPYHVSVVRYRLNGSDTTGLEHLDYNVELAVVDSSSSGYRMEWRILEVRSDNKNQLVRRLLQLSEGMTIRFETNDVGVYRDLVNWEEMRSHIIKSLATVRKQFKLQQGLEASINPVEQSLGSKESIETAFTREIRQYLMFHGARYQLGRKLESTSRVPGQYGAAPLEGKVTMELGEINLSSRNYVMRAIEEVDPGQLREALFARLSLEAMRSGKEAPRREDLTNLRMNIETGTRLHESGWLLYSFQAKNISSGESVSVEETVVEIR